nr:immunoglobulin light chain junction region [Macaca mulatta]
CQEYSSSPFTF